MSNEIFKNTEVKWNYYKRYKTQLGYLQLWPEK